MIAFLKLIRIQNLVIVALLQYLIRWLVIFPVLKELNIDFLHFYGVECTFQVGELNFFLMVLATVFLTAAGYVINDYFDRKTDQVNRPKTVIVGRKINRRTAMVAHVVFNTIGILLGCYVSYVSGMYQAGIIYILVAALLWFYSTNYKRQILTGNVLVAILTAMVPLMVVIYEIPLLNKTYNQYMDGSFNWLANYVLIISYFAFIATLIREIIKDIEDIEGDKLYNSKTLPIAIGAKGAKTVVLILIGILILSLYLIYFGFDEQYFLIYNHHYTFWYILIVLTAPLLFLVYKLAIAKSKNEFHIASNLSKIIMLLGIIYLAFKEVVNYFLL